MKTTLVKKTLTILSSRPEFVAAGSVAIWLTKDDAGNVLVVAETENTTFGEHLVLARITQRGTVEAMAASFDE